MNRFILAIFLSLFIAQISIGQNDSADTLLPIPLDKSVLSGVGLKKIDLKNEPEKDFYQQRLYRGKDISIYVVSTETWNNQMVDFAFDEFIYMFHGEAVVKPQNGSTQLFYSGDYFFAPKGFTGEWEIIAGNNLHYELSVITTQRADSTEISSDLNHLRFDRSTLSGAHIQFPDGSRHKEVLKQGVELTISLNAERPTDEKMDLPAKERLVHLLSGQVTVAATNGVEQTFYSGDFFVIPQGFTGNWNSQGHGLVKYLTVEKTR